MGERATVLDFGIAKLFGDKPLSQKTRTGMMMGTPAYMSPEQCRGAGEVDHRTDVYALGCILFEMLAGRPPFVAEGAGEILGMHQFVEPPALHTLRRDVPEGLVALVMRTLAKKPEQRPQTIAEVATALQAFATAPLTAERSAQLPAASSSLAHQATALSDPGPLASTMSSARGEVSTPTAKPRSKLPFVLGGGVLAVVGAIALVAVASSSSSDGSSTTAPPGDATLRVEADASTVKADVARLLDKARSELAQRNWEDAIATAAQVSVVDAANADAKEIGKRAFAESKHEQTDKALTAAIARDDATAVKAAFSTLAEDSVYRADAKLRYDSYVTTFVANGKKQARALAAQHRCGELARLGPTLAKTFPEAEKVTAGIACSGASIGGETTIKEEPPLGLRQPPRDVTKLVADARAAAISGQHAVAMKLAEEALREAPGSAEAVTVLMLSACNLRDRARVRKYFRRLSPARQPSARQVCLRNGIDPEE